MREIKFRAWDKSHCKMYLVNSVNYTISGSIWYVVTGWTKNDNKEIKNCLHDDLELMQFTGLRDKNGNEIYEGDVVEYKFPDTPFDKGRITTGEISYLEDKASFRLINDEYGELPIHDDIDIEVVGNIYENSELIKE